ncbi:hypothetical protein [Novipirellula sp.]|uniref:hypothetical protein n=1 Tax=Novipirellula sp. TaxID=2795430 RepID=UPI003563595F
MKRRKSWRTSVAITPAAGASTAFVLLDRFTAQAVATMKRLRVSDRRRMIASTHCLELNQAPSPAE